MADNYVYAIVLAFLSIATCIIFFALKKFRSAIKTYKIFFSSSLLPPVILVSAFTVYDYFMWGLNDEGNLFGYWIYPIVIFIFWVPSAIVSGILTLFAAKT
jgi:hypothetical protein